MINIKNIFKVIRKYDCTIYKFLNFEFKIVKEDKFKNLYNQKFILIENGAEKEVTYKELPHGIFFHATDNAKNNIIKIELPTRFNRCSVNFEDASNCLLEIKSTKNSINNMHVHFGQSEKIKIKINKDISVESASILSNQYGSEIEIGEDCMLASDVKIVAADGHKVFDINTGETINYQKHKCSIGNHVWIGDNSRILKNAIIPDNSIVASCSVVTKEFHDTNIILAGNPAKLVKKDINWARDVLTDSEA